MQIRISSRGSGYVRLAQFPIFGRTAPENGKLTGVTGENLDTMQLGFDGNAANLILFTMEIILVMIFWFHMEASEDTMEDRLGLHNLSPIFWSFNAAYVPFFRFLLRRMF